MTECANPTPLQGHDVVHLSEHGLESLSDELIVEKAQEKKLAIVTHDLD
jgi:predicted nuclease of predicted toxin-antitoxin system